MCRKLACRICLACNLPYLANANETEFMERVTDDMLCRVCRRGPPNVGLNEALQRNVQKLCWLVDGRKKRALTTNCTKYFLISPLMFESRNSRGEH